MWLRESERSGGRGCRFGEHNDDPEPDEPTGDDAGRHAGQTAAGNESGDDEDHGADRDNGGKVGAVEQERAGRQRSFSCSQGDAHDCERRHQGDRDRDAWK